MKKEMRKKIEQYIIDHIDSECYDVVTNTAAEKLTFLEKTFILEKQWRLDRNANKQTIFKGWLQGLPSCFTIEFENYKILKLAKSWGSLPENPTEKQEDKILDTYWGFMAFQTLKLIETYKNRR